MFTPSRLSFARKRRGLNKNELAELIGVTQQAISDLEAGRYSPREDTLTDLSRVLGFPIEFFLRGDLPEPSIEGVSFRSLSRMSAAQRNSTLCAGALAFLLNDWIEERFQLPSSDIPDLRHETPKSAAAALRQYWGLGEKPIKNMIHLLESKGVRVYSLAEDTLDVDAFSCWNNAIPFAFLNTMKSAEHSRFDAAHELGHLVLHRHGAPSGINAEKEANAFASAFLMPESSVRASSPHIPTLNQLIKLKRMWIVSVAALLYRLHELGILTDWHYRSLAIEMSQKGFRKKEPESAQRETSQVLAKVFLALRDEGITKATIAKELAISPSELEKLVFGLAIVGISGGNNGQTGQLVNKVELKRVK